MTKDKISVPDTRLNARTRRLFLNHLAETANVAASARAAGVGSSAVYAERRQSAGFRDDWARALGEGYARLETDLLAEALLAANGKTADATLKARAQRCHLSRSNCSMDRCCLPIVIRSLWHRTLWSFM